MYTDRSKKEEEGAISGVLLEGDGLVEEEKGMRVPGEWSITKIEIFAMAMAMKDMKRWGRNKTSAKKISLHPVYPMLLKSSGD